MRFFTIFNPETGELLGQIKTSSPEIADLYPDKIDVSPSEFRRLKGKIVDIEYLRATGRARLKEREDG